MYGKINLNDMKSTEQGYAERIALDIKLFGQAMEIHLSDGTSERVDPMSVQFKIIKKNLFDGDVETGMLQHNGETRKSEVEVIQEISDSFKTSVSTTFGESANSFVKE